ncbi:uncharacterized protein LOC123308201 [Coccinella septempunctata]|uniref:uncharacterized protein LOC123308201 n=1 Tax=Coccinella septempunctata TaxID=41139 RepID=UPI001D09957F|nr:uncharacterized protein LOC123308201 [Coccinella septempunctata]XP_044746711.1 uncharacterized protein LOC123308201 [Coccinella septempunctata]
MIDMDQESKQLLCHICGKRLSSVSTFNRHIKQVHLQEPLTGKDTKNIKCPLCEDKLKLSFGSHDQLVDHIEKIHFLTIIRSTLYFGNKEEFEAWRAVDNRNIDYAFQRGQKIKDDEYIYYNCNRSNTRGYDSKSNQRCSKAGGSIKISGLCPSRICAKITNSGVTVNYIETHAGHDDELRAKHLSKDQQEMLAEKLCAGVTKERILEDARILEEGKLTRMNLLTRGDLAYIIRKFNINKQRDTDDMTATALKVGEMNSQEENTVFLFKQIGENYPELRNEDFALAFMNKIMEKKLRKYSKIICIDGTHGTNIRNWELTTVLVKDENNMGFPVAFLISNRMDQTIQKIFFRSLKARLQESLRCKYIMTDDDIKYFNAWCEAMDDVEKPRRLLCTWHVIKNWNIQGRNKLKKPDNKKEMKLRMRNILKETSISKFLELKDEYFKYLEEENELDFLKYLQNHYFQCNERIMMWAHCHRINVGINTNMAIESLHKVIKYNKMKGHQNLRIEKLLDLLEDLVNEKMWKRVIESERPNVNSYQSRVNREAHIKAEKEVLEKVVCLDSGEFKVFSSKVRDQFYIVDYNELCDDDCRTIYCDKCRICIHKYQCTCPEYTVKTALCKHIHAVALIEKRSDSFPGPGIAENYPPIDEPSTSGVQKRTEIKEFLDETIQNQNTVLTLDPSKKREIVMKEIFMKLESLDDEDFDNMVENINKQYDTLQKNKDQRGKKRKIEKQFYYPTKK